MSISVRPLSHALGAEIAGVDLAKPLSNSEFDQIHRTFLRTLAQRIIDEPRLFRVALGPAWPGHRNHFHFDCAPYRLVEVF